MSHKKPLKRRNILLRADPNRKVISNLGHNLANWAHTDKIYTVDEFIGTFENNELPPELDQALIMIGTNDVRKGAEGMRAAKKLAREITKLSDKNPTIIEIPPLAKNP